MTQPIPSIERETASFILAVIGVFVLYALASVLVPIFALCVIAVLVRNYVIAIRQRRSQITFVFTDIPQMDPEASNQPYDFKGDSIFGPWKVRSKEPFVPSNRVELDNSWVGAATEAFKRGVRMELQDHAEKGNSVCVMVDGSWKSVPAKDLI